MDSFNEEEAERRFLNSKPTCFLIVGKPGSGKSSLAKRLSRAWKCELINGTEVINQALEMQTELGMKAQEILFRGEAIPEELASKILLEKINSPEVQHHGYVLDGFPSLCEDWLPMADQLELVKNLPLTPDFIINLKIPNKDLEKRRLEERVDPLTDEIYTKNVYSPEIPKTDSGVGGEEEEDEGGEEDDEEEEEIMEEEEEFLEEGEEITPDLVARLVCRPEDLPQNVTSSVQQFNDMMLRTLEDYMADFDQQRLIELDANESPKAVFKSLMMKLNTFVLNRALVPMRLQGGEDAEEISDDTETDDLLRTLAATEMIAPKFRWRRSRWSRACPVALKGGNIVQGNAQFSVSFLDKLYVMSTSEALGYFMRNPRPYLAAHLPRPPCKLCVLGPPHSGKTTVARMLADRYNAKVLDVDELVKPRKEAAKKKMLEETRQEAIESAISKVTAEVQSRQMEEEEEEEKSGNALGAGEEDDDEEEKGDENDKEKEEQEGEEKTEAKEEDAKEKTKEEGEDEQTEEKEEKEESDMMDDKQAEEGKPASKPEPLPIDANHPQVIKIVEEVMSEASKREPELSAEEFVDVVEEAIQQRYAELQEMDPEGPVAGFYVLDDFPRSREQFSAMVERNIIPDEVVCMRDDSENGEFLLKRWYKDNKEGLFEIWESRRLAEKARIEAERAEQERLEREEAARKAAEEARLREEEERAAAERAAAERAVAGEGDEGGEAGEPKNDAEDKEGPEEEKETEDAKAADHLEAKPTESLDSVKTPEEELQSRESEEVLAPLNLESDIPPDTPETEEYKKLRVEHDRDFSQLISVVKGINNIDPVFVSVEKEIQAVSSEVVRRVEAQFNYRPWEYTGMDQDEEEEDFAEEEEEDEEEGENPFIKDKKKIFGDTKHFCPVLMKEKNVLWPGIPECAAKYRERTYFFSSPEAKTTFMENPEQFVSKDRPLQPPPVRLMIVGPKGSGKTLHGRELAKKLGVFHISFKDRLQELIIAKTKKKIGPEYEEEEEEELDPAVVPPEGLEDSTVPESGQTDGSDGEGEEGKEGEQEVELTEDEENIRANLTDDELLPYDTLDKILPTWWNEEPFRSTGFILEGFPRNVDEAKYLSTNGLFPDGTILLAVEDTAIVERLLPPKLEKWKKKRDRRLAEKERKKELAKKLKEENRAKRREEKMAEIATRKAERQARRAQRDSDDSEEEEEEEEEEDIEALLDAEEEDEEEVEEEEEETEEEAIERLKTEIGDRYDDETSKIGTIQETLEEISIPRIEINAGRKPRIVRYCIDRALKPVVDFRESLFDRCFAIDGFLANRMLFMGYKFASRFGRWCPVKLLEGCCIQPQFGPGIPSYPVAYRQHVYFCSSEEARDSFMQFPAHYLKQPSPRPVVPIRMAIIGPPKAGKTTLAERFASEYGVVRLSVGEAMRKILVSQPHTELARQINLHVRSGNTVPDELAVQALEIALMDMQCQTRGFILDGYPLTMNQIELMTQRKIIPVKVLELRVEEEEVLRRGTVDRHSPSRVLPLHDSHQILAIRLACWQREVGAVRAWYRKEHRNWVSLDGQRSKWWVWHEALDEASKGVSQIQTYLQRLSEGKAASIADMCVRPDEFNVRLGDFLQYCPVSLAEKGELFDCSVNSSLEFAAEFRGRYYKMASRTELELFLADPARYVPPQAPRKLPPQELLPRRCTAVEVKAMFPKQIELQGYCPVTYLDGKLRYESIVPGDQELVVEYTGKLYYMESETKLQKFMRLPEKYSSLVLPHKLPPRKDPLPVSGLPMLGYMEQTVATAITKALTAVGCLKPKYPFLDAKRSALLYVAYHLKAHNPKSSDYVRKKYKQKLMRFEEECELIKYLGDQMTIRYKEPDERPIDFDHKMTNFLSLKGLEPNLTWRA